MSSSLGRARIPCITYLFEKPVKYMRAWNWQQQIMQDHIKGRDNRDVLLLLEHPSVYTMGRSAKSEYLRFDEAGHKNGCGEFDVHRIDRGGQVTYHCPGQIVGYPLLDLRRFKKDLRWYLHELEEVLIRVMARYDIDAHRHEEHTGVWHGSKKLAAIGINCSRWFTMHGFALNVSPDLKGFSRIVPCGITDSALGVSSMKECVPSVDINRVRSDIIEEFESVFQVQCLIQRDSSHPPLQVDSPSPSPSSPSPS